LPRCRATLDARARGRGRPARAVAAGLPLRPLRRTRAVARRAPPGPGHPGARAERPHRRGDPRVRPRERAARGVSRPLGALVARLRDRRRDPRARRTSRPRGRAARARNGARPRQTSSARGVAMKAVAVAPKTKTVELIELAPPALERPSDVL